MSRLWQGCAALVAALGLFSATAQAQGIEPLVQIEPDAGGVQAEYYGDFTGEGEHQFELLAGLSDRLALGAEAEFEAEDHGLAFEGVGLIALWRLTDPDAERAGSALALETEFDSEARFRAATARLIAERHTDRWWTQADAIMRHRRVPGAHGTGLAYALAASRALGDGLWLGIEASGQLARLGGDADLAPAGAHYAGPALTIELPIGPSGGREREIEISAAWMVRLAGEGPASGPRLSVQLTL